MFLNLDGPVEAQSGDSLNFTGSAWIKTGPLSPVTFKHYKLLVAPEGSSDWMEIVEATDAVREDILGTWDTTELPVGSYRIRLVLWVDGDTTAHPTHQYPEEIVIKLVGEDESPQHSDGSSGRGCFITTMAFGS